MAAMHTKLYAQGDGPCQATLLDINACGSTTYYHNIGAGTSGYTDPSCGWYFGGDIWFKAVVPASGSVMATIKNTGGLKDPAMAMYDGSNCGSLSSEVACNDDSYDYYPSSQASGLTPGDTVWIRIHEIGAVVHGGFALMLNDPSQVPTCQATNISAKAGNDTATITWAYGSGQKHIVLMKATNSDSELPPIADGNTYTADAAFGSGSELGTGWYCVFNGMGDQVAISNLAPATDYRVVVYTYNEPSGATSEIYQTGQVDNNPYNFLTEDGTKAPGRLTHTIDHGLLGEDQMPIDWETGSGDARVGFIKQTGSSMDNPPVVDGATYTANPAYGSGTETGTGWYCFYNGSGTNSEIITGLTKATDYRIVFYEYNMNAGAGSEVYSTQIDEDRNAFMFTSREIGVTPAVQTSELRMDYYDNYPGTNPPEQYFAFKRGNGNSRIVFIKQTSATTGTPPVSDGVSYTSSSTFGSGDEVGTGWYCVQNSGSPSFIVKGLVPGADYRMVVMEYETTTPNYNTSFAAVEHNPVNFTFRDSLNTPSSQTWGIEATYTGITNLEIKWKKGAGIGRAIFVKQTSSTSETPNLTDGNSYMPNLIFGQGDDEGNGWYCVFNAYGLDYDNTTEIKGLEPGKDYRIMVVDYNMATGTGSEKYLLDTETDNPLSVTTRTSPYELVVSFPAISDITCNGLTDGSLEVSVSNGTTPYTYTWSNGASTQSISGLSEGTYSITVTDNVGKTQTGNASIVAPAAVDLYNTTVTHNTVAGGSAGKISIAASGGTGTLQYSVGGSYQATPNFTGLSAGTYPLHVRDANSCGDRDTVEVSEPVTAPTVQASNLAFSNVTDSSMTVSWARGNGYQCLVAMKPTSLGLCAPVDNTHYIVSPEYGSSSTVDGWYFVYKGNGTSVDVSKLNADTEYRVMVMEYDENLGNGDIVYLKASATQNPANQATMAEIVCDLTAEAGPGQNLCAGDTATLAASGGSTYQWSGGMVQDTSFVPTVTAMYYVTVSDTNSCTAADSLTITVNPLPAVSISSSSDTVIKGNSATLTASGANTYVWNYLSASQAEISVNPDSTTAYTVTGTDANGCVDTENITIVVVTGTGLEQWAEIELSLYPNPTDGKLFVESPEAVDKIEVYNQGSLVKTIAPFEGRHIDLTSLPAGVYYIRLYSGEGVVVRKISLLK